MNHRSSPALWAFVLCACAATVVLIVSLASGGFHSSGRTGGSPQEQCSKPIAERVGGWVC